MGNDEKFRRLIEIVQELVEYTPDLHKDFRGHLLFELRELLGEEE